MSRILVINKGNQSKFNDKIIAAIDKVNARTVTFLNLHTTYVYPESDVPYVENLQVNENISSLKNLYCKLRDYDHIVFNSFFYDWKLKLIFFFLTIFKERSWIVWGGDLYKNHSYLWRCAVSLGYFSRIALAIPGDVSTLRKYFSLRKVSIVGFWFPLMIPEESIRRIRCVNAKNKTSKKIILVGNSATESNNHLDILEMLSGQKIQDFDLIIPLSYGNNKYADKVESEAIRLFGAERVISLRHFIDFDSYLSLLGSVDIFISNQNRQQGGHNLFMAASLGAALVISRLNPIKNLLEENGVAVNEFNSSMKLTEIKNQDEKSIKSALKLISPDREKKIVNNFFRDIVNECT